MFHKEDDLDKELMFKKCPEKVADPRLVPGDESECNSCIQQALDETGKSSQFKCSMCNPKSQSVSKNSNPIQKLLSIKSDGEIQDLTAIIHLLKSRINELDARINRQNTKNELKNYTEFLRSDIEIIAESAIEYIRKFRDELTEKVNIYERECIENIEKKVDHSRAKFESLSCEIENFNAQWCTYLDGFKLNSDDVRGAIKSANRYLNELECEELNHKRIKYNDHMLKFREEPQENINSKILGEIYHTRRIYLDTSFVDLLEVSKLKLAPVRIDFVTMEQLKSGNYLLLYYSNQNLMTNVALLDRTTYRPLKEIVNLFTGRFDNLLTCECDNRVYACFVVNFQNRIVCLDASESLTESRSISLDSPINSISVNGANLFAWTSIGSKMFILTKDLELVRTIQLNVRHPHEPFYLPKFITKMKCDDENFYLIDFDSNLIIMNLNGLMVCKFRLDFADFFVSRTELARAVCYDSENKSISHLDLNDKGRPIKVKKFKDQLPDDLQLTNISSYNDQLILYSNFEKNYYFFLNK